MNAQQLSVFALEGATALYAIALVAYSIRAARAADARGRGQEAPTGGRAAGIARAAVTVGAALHLAGIVLRGVEAGHAPWTTLYEYTVTGSFVAVATFLVVQRLRRAVYLGPGVTGFALLALAVALGFWYREAGPLQPALQNYWLVVHVSIATVATGILTVGAITTAFQLGRDYRDAGARLWSGRALRVLDGFPPPARLEALAFRLHAVGFVLWTFTVVSGAIWANDAWGRPWAWDPKEVWSFVVWVLYAAYLHARTTRGWAGRKAAWLAMAAALALLFNFTVVNLVINGLHSYAGV